MSGKRWWVREWGEEVVGEGEGVVGEREEVVGERKWALGEGAD